MGFGIRAATCDVGATPNAGNCNHSDRWLRTRIRCPRMGFAPTAERQRRALGGQLPSGSPFGSRPVWLAVSSVAGAKITNHRIPAHSERRALVFQRFLFP